MQVVAGLFTSGKVALKLLLTQFFSNILSSQYFFFYSGTVTREVKNGKWYFHNCITGRNAIVFRKIFMTEKS